MRKKAIINLVKDVVIFGIAFGILAAILAGVEEKNLIWAYCIAGIPCGWRWASHLLTAVSGKGILLKLLISVFLGWVAVPVMFIKDIINVLKYIKKPVEGEIEE